MIYPILAYGAYLEPAARKPRVYFHRYNEAKAKILSDIKVMFEQIHTMENYFLSEKVICARLEPDLDLKHSAALITSVSAHMKCLGWKTYSCTTIDGNQSARLYFIRTTDQGIEDLRKILISGEKDSDADWKKHICSFHSLDFLTPEERIIRMSEKWKSGIVKMHLHPMGKDSDNALNLLYELSGISKSQTKIFRCHNGSIVIRAKCTRDNIERIKLLNSLRSVHFMQNALEDLSGGIEITGEILKGVLSCL